ncbi:ketopantoate reductase family protein [Schumannella sp. 10F1B-5-1]|uniref:ketopantoate reductase family protein n=1 Tax=Schumannella sp. 10F1B-5-1 TaxID=2590780 RepID=UPI0011304A95|nr:2-dehydropantoate 2-reductase [Schumannella sp. 10F1B-5-1]TPW70734.1 2-dehydropantoate 2-reductase [Schumannella sp. 10F1B-5-1]
MRIGIIGAGAIGGTIAALLDRGGHDVAVTARGEHLAAIRRDGLLLTGGWGEHRALLDAGEVLTGRFDLVVATTKAAAAEKALGMNAAALGDGVPLVVVQNGLDGIAVARRAAPRAEAIGALSLIAASFLVPGEVTVTAPLPTVLGREPGADPAPLRFAADLLGQVMPIETVDDLRGAQWTKLLINHVNALPAITGLSVQQVVADPRLRRILTASMRETVRLARALGIRFAPLRGLTDARLGLLGAAPLALGGLLPRAMARQMGDVPNPGSTLQSIRRGQPTEIDALNGAVVREAAAAGRTAPISAALTALVHEVEQGGFLPVDEVVRRVPLR